MQEGGPNAGGWARPQPPGPAPGVAYAGFWIRTAAFLIDFISLLIVGGCILVVASLAGTATVGSGVALSIASAVTALAGIVYFVGGWVGWSRTPGMALAGLYVVRAADGGPVHIGRALVRYATLPVSFAILFLGVIWVGFDGQKQSWHDKIAGTLVVKPFRP